MIKTIAYEHMKLYGPKTIPLTSELSDFSRTPMDTIMLRKDDLKRFSDNYKVLSEFVMQFFGYKEVNTWDIVSFYHKFPEGLYSASLEDVSTFLKEIKERMETKETYDK